MNAATTPATTQPTTYFGEEADPLRPHVLEPAAALVTCTRCHWTGDLWDLVMGFDAGRFVASCPACSRQTAQRAPDDWIDLDSLPTEADAA